MQEIREEVRKLEREELDFEIEIGVKTRADRVELIERQLIEAQTERQALERQLSETATTEEKVLIEERIAEVRKVELDLRRSVTAEKQAIYDEDIKALEARQKKELRVIRRTTEQNALFSETIINRNRDRTLSRIQTEENKELARLESLHERKLISDERFEARKQEIQEKARKQTIAVEATTKGEFIRLDQEKELAELAAQKAALEEQLVITPPESEAAKRIREQLDEIAAAMNEKGDTLKQSAQILKGGIADITGDLISFDIDGMKDSMRRSLATVAGYLKKLLTATMAEIVLESEAIKGFAA